VKRATASTGRAGTGAAGAERGPCGRGWRWRGWWRRRTSTVINWLIPLTAADELVSATESVALPRLMVTSRNVTGEELLTDGALRTTRAGRSAQAGVMV